jgi:hypothetical protein
MPSTAPRTRSWNYRAVRTLLRHVLRKGNPGLHAVTAGLRVSLLLPLGEGPGGGGELPRAAGLETMITASAARAGTLRAAGILMAPLTRVVSGQARDTVSTDNLRPTWQKGPACTRDLPPTVDSAMQWHGPTNGGRAGIDKEG